MKKLILIGVGVIVLGGGGAAAAFFWPRHAATEATAAPKKPVQRGLVSFEPFVVNLADKNVARFLRVSVQVVIEGSEEAEKIQKTPVQALQARSAILDVLTTQTSEELATAEGKTALKKELAERVATALGEIKVLDVLFSDFVIQY